MGMADKASSPLATLWCAGYALREHRGEWGGVRGGWGEEMEDHKKEKKKGRRKVTRAGRVYK